MRKEMKGKLKRYIHFLIILLVVITFYRIIVLGEERAALGTIIILILYLFRKKVKEFTIKRLKHIQKILIEKLEKTTSHEGYEEEDIEEDNQEGKSITPFDML